MFPQIFGKYVLEREIAGGGMARVYLATLRGAVGFEKRLVVKQIRPELASDEAFVRRFIEEAKTAVELGHPNIVPVYELGVEQGVYYIAMELCEGVTLSEVLRSTGSLSPDEGAYVGIEICRALDYAHRKAGIVHRDVTPRNVMIDEEGAVRLIDFGIAAPVTIDGAVRPELFGSPGHMPPEQVHGGTLTPSSDVFAVAVLLVEAWTGKPPFRRSTPEKCLEALDQPVPSIAEHDPDLEPVADLVAQALSHEPERRPESAESFARPLRDFVKTSDLGDLSRRLGTRVRKVRRKARASQPALDVEATPAPVEGVDHTPVGAEMEVTRTFAAREEIVEWTRKLPSIPPPGDDAEEKADTRASHTDETSPTTSSQRRASVPAKSSVWPLVAVVAVGAAVVGVLSLREPSPEKPVAGRDAADAAVAITTERTPVPSTPTSGPVTPPASSRAPVPQPKLPPRSSGIVPNGSAAAPPSSAGTPPVGRAILNLTSTPPALVSVAGRARGTTPVIGLELPAGSYFVQFQSPVLDERVPAQVNVAAGQTRTVHADFTAASPRVHIR
jgi:serine/threonine-protein kinase